MQSVILDETSFVAKMDELMEIYQRAFVLPDNERLSILERFERHRKRQDFKAVLAVGDDGKALGFCYGYKGYPGEWWHDQVRSRMSIDMAASWMNSSFELAEVAIDPNAQGRGIGGILMEKLLMDVDATTALLCVRVNNSNALSLYNKQGWNTLIEEMSFPSEELGYAIMGKRLAHVGNQPRPTA